MTPEVQTRLEALLAQANKESINGNHDLAEQLTHEVLAECDTRHPKGNTRDGIRADAMLRLCLIEGRRDNYNLAIERAAQAITIADECQRLDVKAKAWNEMGIVHYRRAQYDEAVELWTKSLVLSEELGDKKLASTVTGNLGNVHLNRGNYDQALFAYTKAIAMHREHGDKVQLALMQGNVGLVYMRLAMYDKAFACLNESLSLSEEVGDARGIATALTNIGNLHYNIGSYDKALEVYGKALAATEALGKKADTARVLGNIGNVYWGYGSYDKALEYMFESLAVQTKLGSRSDVARTTANIGNVHKDNGDFAKALEYCNKALALNEELGEVSGISSALGMIGSVYGNRAFEGYDALKAEEYHRRAMQLSSEIGSRFNVKETHKSLSELYEKEQRWEEAHLHYKKYIEIEKELNIEEFKKQELIHEQQKAIELAKATADAEMKATTVLLHRVLPASIAARIIAGEHEIADYFPQVSILFADIKGFTTLSSDMPATVVVRFLKHVFGEFDRVIRKHGCEKVKTIGDGYMAVAGAPVPCDDHAERLAAAALEMQKPILLPNDILAYLPEGTRFGVRIGLHTGPIVAGVIGEERFVYDIYSDAVNTAARMESHGEENKIHVSNDFFRHMQNRFAMTKNTTHGLVFEKRGEMEIKGKGQMRTYFLERA